MNETTSLPLGGDLIGTELVTSVKALPVEGRVIVVNPAPTPAYVAAEPRRFVPPFSSTILVDVAIDQADSVLLLRPEPERTATLAEQPGWSRFDGVDAPLWRGPRSRIGSVTFDPGAVLGEPPSAEREFDVWVNLWFAPAGTDCGIHNEHDFLETHTQVHGSGRMQKFTAPRHDALYEDVPMSPGATHEPFCGTAGDTFRYPWHQYRADTDCVWLAVEYHARRR
jgi:hypothetical protein